MKTTTDVIISMGFANQRYSNVKNLTYVGHSNNFLSFETQDGRLMKTTLPYIIETGVALNVRALILDTLSQGSYHPAELLEKFESQISEDRLKDELIALFESNIVELSPNRHIRLRRPLRRLNRSFGCR